MDLYGIIRELRKEHDHLNDVIRSLDMLVKNEENSLPESAPKPRGRKRMSQAERRKVSQRMRKYWEARRKK